MENLKDHKFKCTGCFLCVDICPTHAIKMHIDCEGFYEYEIDDEKCIKCGLCTKKCPKLNKIIFNKSQIDCYAVYSKDNEIVSTSTSGGYFSELAKVILNEGGVVVGATWDKGIVKHIVVKEEKNLNKLRSSKYLQSNLSGTYNEIKKALNSNKKVLFSGTPCQVAAINKQFDDDNLITVDLVCHGVPSKTVFEKSLKDRFNKKINVINFRKKIKSWTKYSLTYDDKVVNKEDDEWFRGFLDNKYLKKDCYDCPFVSKKRIGDITLGDFWGINKIDEEFFAQNGDKGINLVLLNNSKARALFEKTKDNIVYKKQDSNLAFQYNPRLFEGKYNSKFLEDRNLFYQQLSKGKIQFKNKTRLDNIIIFIKRVINKLKRMIGSK